MEEWTSETIVPWLRAANAWLTAPLFTIGDAAFSVASLLKFLLFVVLVVWLSRWFRRWLTRRMFPRLHVEVGTAEALANMVGYLMIALGLLVGLQATGIELSALTVLFGALGVGVGFGLQTIASNFVSGIIILMERPIQVGDRIQLGELHGRVSRVKIRATEILTNDNIAVIVPNSEFISQRVINWSRGGNQIRIRVPVHVAYGSDLDQVREALLEAAGSLDVVLKDPKPEVRMTGFGDSALEFELLGWTRELLHRRGAYISRLNFAIHETLKGHGIEIPFPRRDVHLRSAVPLSPAKDERT